MNELDEEEDEHVQGSKGHTVGIYVLSSSNAVESLVSGTASEYCAGPFLICNEYNKRQKVM